MSWLLIIETCQKHVTGTPSLQTGYHLDFHTIVDPDKHPPQPWRDLPPAPGLPPYRISLDTILDPATIKSIEDSGKLVFHSVGDTGGVNTPTYIEGVSRFMECDMAYSRRPDRPSFFYHLGDVVYYDGESANYWPEFYEPYLNYHAPIVAIPGNHDGDVNPATANRVYRPSFATFVPNRRPLVPTTSMHHGAR